VPALNELLFVFQISHSYGVYILSTCVNFPLVIQATLASDFQYAGYYLHSASGLGLTTNRAYNSSLGRWINRNPIQETGGINLFAYVRNIPVSLTDRTGLTDLALPGGGSVSGGGAAAGGAAGAAEAAAGSAELSGPLGLAGAAFIWSIYNWSQSQQQESCGEECLRRYRIATINGANAQKAYKDFKCCMVNKCKFDWNDVEKGKDDALADLKRGIDKALNQLNQNQNYIDFLKGLGINPQ
jgi:RHS repeat-associated protein